MSRLSSEEVLYWQAWQKRNGPISPSQRADLHNARLMAHIAEIFRDSSNRAKPFTVKDFLPDYGTSEDGGTPGSGMTKERIISWMHSLASTYDGVTITHGEPG